MRVLEHVGLHVFAAREIYVRSRREIFVYCRPVVEIDSQNVGGLKKTNSLVVRASEGLRGSE